MSAISLIDVSTDQLGGDIRRLRETLGRARDHIEGLRVKMEVLNGMWEGPANLAMRRRFQEDHQRMLDLCGSLEELIETLESIRRAYDACEDQVRSAVDALRV